MGISLEQYVTAEKCKRLKQLKKLKSQDAIEISAKNAENRIRKELDLVYLE